MKAVDLTIEPNLSFVKDYFCRFEERIVDGKR